jgi:pseudoazurin
MLKTILATGAVVGLLTVAGQAAAAEIQVKMLNKGAQGAMVFEPAEAKLKPGDTVRFIPTDKGHNVETIKELLPPGAELVKSPLSQEIVVKFAKPGVYGFKCTPHWGFGMAFVAKVGPATNLAQAEAAIAKTPPMAKKRLTQSFAAIK